MKAAEARAASGKDSTRLLKEVPARKPPAKEPPTKEPPTKEPSAKEPPEKQLSAKQSRANQSPTKQLSAASAAPASPTTAPAAPAPAVEIPRAVTQAALVAALVAERGPTAATVEPPAAAPTAKATNRRPSRPASPTVGQETRPAAAPAGPAAAPGTVDVGTRIRRKARVVRSADLASRIDKVQILNMSTIQELIREAVNETVILRGTGLSDAEKRALLEESEAKLKERLELLEAEKASFEEKSEVFTQQLLKAQRLLDEERSRALSPFQFTLSGAGMVELEQKLGRILDRSVEAGQMSPQLEEEMRAVVLRLLDDEREKIRAQAVESQNDKIALLEKKVERLAGSLQSAEGERDRARALAQALEAAGGSLRNVYTAGMKDDDPLRGKKMNLLEGIIKENKALREKLAADGYVLPARKAVPSAAETAPAPAPAPPVAENPPPEPARVDAEAPGADPFLDGDEEKVPVLATGGDADPDDQPWEPPKDASGGGSAGVAIRRLDG